MRPKEAGVSILSQLPGAMKVKADKPEPKAEETKEERKPQPQEEDTWLSIHNDFFFR